MKFNLFPKLAVRGLATVYPAALAFANSGDSFIFRRIRYEMPIIRMDTQTGMRQPQAENSFSPKADLVSMMTNSEVNKPSVAVVWI